MTTKKTGRKGTAQSVLDDVLVGPLPIKENFPDPFSPNYLRENIKIATIGHLFTEIPTKLLMPGEPKKYVVQDFLLDQTGFSGCSARMRLPFNANLNLYTGYRIMLLPKGYTGVNVSVPVDTIVHFGCELRR